MITIGLYQWIPTITIKTYQLSGKSLLNQLLHIMKDLSPFGKPENTHSMVFNSIHKRTVLNGKLMLIDHLMQLKFNK